MTIRQINTDDEFDQIELYLSTFDHKPLTRVHQTFVVEDENGIAGIFEAVPTMVIYPAIKPVSSPRRVLRGILNAIRFVATQVNMQIIGMTPPDKTKFTPEIMSHFGLEEMPHKPYLLTQIK